MATVVCRGCGVDSNHKKPFNGCSVADMKPLDWGVAWEQANGLECYFYCAPCSEYVGSRAREIFERLNIKYTYLHSLLKLGKKP